MSIRVMPGFRECGECPAVRREQGAPDTDEGQGICLARPEMDATGKLRYPLVQMAMPDGFDQLHPWSPEHHQRMTGGCFPPASVGEPVEWDDVRATPEAYTVTRDLSDN